MIATQYPKYPRAQRKREREREREREEKRREEKKKRKKETDRERDQEVTSYGHLRPGCCLTNTSTFNHSDRILIG